jgi:hypothetical protein
LIGIARFWHQGQLFQRQKSICYSWGWDPMNMRTISIIISIPTILQNGVLIIPMSKFRKYREYPSDHKRIIEKVNWQMLNFLNGKKGRQYVLPV